MSRSIYPLVFVAVLLAACGAEPDHAGSAVTEANVPDVLTDTVVVGPLPSGEAGSETARAQALDVALDSLEAFVTVLERVEGPIAAWNLAEEAARLLRYLERNSAAFALDLSKEEAKQRYPVQMQRLDALEARRTAELERINEDGVAGRVLVEEMAKADAAAKAAGQ